MERFAEVQLAFGRMIFAPLIFFVSLELINISFYTICLNVVEMTL